MPLDYKQALAGLTVLDFTSMMAGPLCARYIADLGARVIKIEPPGGEYMRSRPPLRDGNSAYFAHLNAGKESVSLDLKKPSDVARTIEMAADADIVLESFRPGTMERLGLGYETLRTANPKLIYATISGFGPTGPMAGRAAYAQVIHALSGFDMAHMSYQRDQEAPSNSVIFVADVMGAVYSLTAILTALRQRDLDGQGHRVDTSMIDTMTNLLVYEVQSAQFPQMSERPRYDPIRTSDGFLLIAPTTQKNFEAICKVLQRPELLDDPRFVSVQSRYDHWDSVMALLQDWGHHQTTADAEAVLLGAGVPCGRYNTPAQALDDPELGLRERLATTHDESGPVGVPRLPFRVDGTPVSVGGIVPPAPLPKKNAS